MAARLNLHPVPILTRLMRKASIQPNGCWLWTGSRDRGGYGDICIDKRTQRTHRVAYELFVGPIPEGLQIDHLCRNRACLNPEHLEAVTQQENIRRGRSGIHQAAKTHCPHGHPYSGSNLRIKYGARRCRICIASSARAWRANRKAA